MDRAQIRWCDDPKFPVWNPWISWIHDFSRCFLLVFPCFFHNFPTFFHVFSIFFQRFPMFFPYFSNVFPCFFHFFSNGFPMFFTYFSNVFPCFFHIFPTFFHVFSIFFQRFSHVFSMVFWWFSRRFSQPNHQRPRHSVVQPLALPPLLLGSGSAVRGQILEAAGRYGEPWGSITSYRMCIYIYGFKKIIVILIMNGMI